MDITPANLQQFWQRLDFSYSNALKTVPTYWSKIATEIPSETESNVYPFLSMIPTYKEWIGPRQINNVAARAFTVPNKHWELTLGIDADKFNDDTYNIYGPMMPAIAQQVAEWRDRELARVVEAGTSQLCWDGQYFFDTDHPVDPDNSGAGVNVNKLVGATYDIAVADPLAPYALARAAQMLWKREDNLQLGIMGNLIMVHPNEEKYARQICAASLTAQAIGSAAAGVSNVFAGACDYIVNPYLTVTSGRPWYLLATNRGINPFIWQNRQAPNLVPRTNMTDDNVYRMKRFEWGIDERGAASYGFPFLAFRMSAS